MKDSLKLFIDKAASAWSSEKGVELPQPFDYDVVVSRDTDHGDFAANVAFRLAKAAKQKPADVAKDLIPHIQKAAAGSSVEKLEVAGAGFINFYLSKSSRGQILHEIQKQDKSWGRTEMGKGKKVLLEFVSANPTGPLTIAHGRQAAVGDALARILRASGHDVQAEYYLNDAGRQMNLLGASLLARYKEAHGQPLELPEDGYKGLYMMDLAKKLKEEKGDSLLKEAQDKAADFCRLYASREIMSGIIEDMSAIGVKFDSYFNESSLYGSNEVRDALEALKKNGYLFEQDGALWFRSTDFGDDKDRVVQKSTGEYTYLAPDIAYHKKKFERGFQRLINFWGPDHHGYIPRMRAACQALGYNADQMDVRIVQLTTLYRKGEPVRMSTRAGEFVTLHELVQEVGADATRCFFVMRKIESHLDFDLDLAKEKSQENPVYYLQYGHARIASLLKFAGRPVVKDANVARLTEDEEKDLIKRIGEYPVMIQKASEILEPYRLADYLRDLAAAFHKFYAKCRVVTEDAELTDARLLLADCARMTLRNGLELLGISQPESM